MLSKKSLLIILPLLFSSVCNASTESATQPQTPSADSGWMNSIGNTLSEWKNKIPELTGEAKAYSEKLKNDWPSVKAEFKKQWANGVEKGKEAEENAEEWMNKTFQKEHVQKAEKWLTDFKKGTEEKVIDPLVPYLLSVRYSNPLNEWNDGYRREFPVQVQKKQDPVLISLPISWDLAENVNFSGEKLLSWKNDAGNGNLCVSLMSTSSGSTVESLMAGLERQAPGNKAVTLPSTSIQRLYIASTAPDIPSSFYYAVPTREEVVLLSAQVLPESNDTAQSLNDRLQTLEPFFDTVAKNVFVRPKS